MSKKKIQKKKIQKKKALKKKVVAPKKTAKKAVPSKKHVAKVKEKPKAKEVKEIKPVPTAVVEAIPVRAPLRKIIGAGRSITIVPREQKVPATTLNTAESHHNAAPPPQVSAVPVVPAVEIKQRISVVSAAVNLPKSEWGSLPRSLPAQLRFLVSMAKKECKDAERWPFPFAKFIAALPEKICGREFALLCLSLEHELNKIAGICKIQEEQAIAQLIHAANNFKEFFTSACPEISRKIQTQLAGSGVGVDSIMEPYLIANVDRNFQILLGSILLKSLSEDIFAPGPLAANS